jgi:hypothetical protein
MVELGRPTWTTDVAGREGTGAPVPAGGGGRGRIGRCATSSSPAVRVGARSIAGLVLSDGRVSGLHFDTPDEGGYRLRDLGSTNGTFVSGIGSADTYLRNCDDPDRQHDPWFHPLHDVTGFGCRSSTSSKR